MNFCFSLPALAVHCKFFVALCCFALPSVSSAAIIVTDYYQLGESDPGATVHAPAIATQDISANLAGANVMSRALVEPGSPFPTYDDTFNSSANVKLRSTISAYFDTVDTVVGRFQATQPSTLATDHFGIEGWFLPESSQPTQGLVYNGISESSGFGLFIHNNTYQAYLAVVGFVDSGVTVSTSDWTYFAMVRDGGLIRLYVNGTTPVVTLNGAAATIPALAGDSFVIGSNVSQGRPGGIIEHRYNGSADEVRVFEFASGQFNASSDLLYSVPEPSGSRIFPAGLSLHSGFRRCRRRRSE